MILAKSFHNICKKNHTLTGHTEDVYNSFHILFGYKNTPTRLLKDMFNFLKLNQEQYIEDFFKYMELAIFLHDVGKSNSGFQHAVEKHDNTSQTIRHEHLSTILIYNTNIIKYLIENNYNIEFLTGIICSHHLKFNYNDFGIKFDTPNKKTTILKEGLEDIDKLIREKINIKLDFSLNIEDIIDVNSFEYEKIIKKIKTKFCNFHNNINNETISFYRMCNIALIIADASGSAIPRTNKDLNWLTDAFENKEDLTKDYIYDNIINPRIKEIEKKSKQSFEFYDFQKESENFPERTLMINPCGAGKTLGAYVWAGSIANKTKIKNLIFLYPTKDTSTEGFKDYCFDAPETDASLLHSASDYELKQILESPDSFGKNFQTEEAMYALGLWNKKVFCSTIDQFLGFLQLSYKSICLFPMLSQSLIIVDEVHSLDKKLFNLLLKFIENFNIPILAMSATVSESKITEFKKRHFHIFPSKNHELEDLKKIEDTPRYIVRYVDKFICERKSIEYQKMGKKIIWYNNTVDSCQKNALEIGNAICYHSRFKLSDRRNIRNLAINTFKSKNLQTYPILSCSQIAEMSFDIDGDMAISELSPINSLIQRFGRVGRVIEKNRICEIFIYKTNYHLPYEEEDLKSSEKFIKHIQNKPISQKQLQEAYEKFDIEKNNNQSISSFFEEAPWSKSHEYKLRDINDFNKDTILDNDENQYLERMSKKEHYNDLIIPVPIKYAKKPDNSHGYNYFISPSKNYSPIYGFMKDEIIKY